MGVSLNPKDQVKGGLIADVDAVLSSIRFQEYTYPSGETTLAAIGKLLLDGGDEYEQVWSVGNPADWEILHDGEEINPAEGNSRSGTADNSNFSQFMRELAPAGWPEQEPGVLKNVQDKISALDGMKAHWIRKAQPARAGLSNTNARGQERTVLVPEKILKLPWEKGKAAAAAKGNGAQTKSSTSTATTAPSADAGADFENEAAMSLASEVLDALKEAKAGTTAAKSDWSMLTLGWCSKNDTFKTTKDQPLKDAVKRLLKNAEFLRAQDVTVDDKGAVTLPAA
jgi:hypothetical protein